MDRRSFFRNTGLGVAAGAASTLFPFERAVAAIPRPVLPPGGGAADDEAYWAQVRAHFDPPTDYLDFDQANTGPTPLPVFEAYVRRARWMSRAPADRFGKVWKELEDLTRPRAAQFFGTTIGEIAFVSSATTALNTVLHGFPLQPGDEVLVTDHEYPDMIETLLQRARRYGIVMKTVQVPGPDDDGADLVRRVEQAITSKTKLLLISEVSAWNAEVLPVKAVSAAARARGVAVLVDAAQSVGILETNFADMGCDFLGASLHKAIGAPVASGILLIRKEHIGRVAPLHPPSWDSVKYPTDRYEWSGAFQVPAYVSAAEAMEFQTSIGLARKRARLRYLGDRWQTAVAGAPKVRLLTPRDPARSFGTASIAIDGLTSEAICTQLRERHGIATQEKNIRHSPYREAVRISPGAHVSVADVDRLAEAILDIARRA